MAPSDFGQIVVYENRNHKWQAGDKFRQIAGVEKLDCTQVHLGQPSSRRIAFQKALLPHLARV
jgi:hypothetical protein